MIKNMICITCPNGCHLTVDTDTMTVSGNRCPRGITYAMNELTHPVRTVTSTVKLEGAFLPRCPVKTSEPIDKNLMGKVVEELKKYTLTAPVKTGDVVISHIFDSPVDIVVTRDFDKI